MTTTDTTITESEAVREAREIIATELSWINWNIEGATDVSREYARHILAALADRGLRVVREDADEVTISTVDAGLCHDAAFHRMQEVRDPVKRMEYQGLAARMYDAALTEPGRGDEH